MDRLKTIGILAFVALFLPLILISLLAIIAAACGDDDAGDDDDSGGSGDFSSQADTESAGSASSVTPVSL